MNFKQKKILLILFCLLPSITLLGQQKIAIGTLKVDSRLYTITGGDPVIKSSGFWVRDNVDFIKRHKDNPKALFRLERTDFTTTENPKSVIMKVLGEKRVRELAEGKGVVLPIYLYPDYTGSIQAIEFRLTSGHTLTIEELDEIYVYFKRNLSFRMPANLPPGQLIFPITYVIRFKSLLSQRSNFR